MYKRLLDHCHPRLKLAIKAFSRKNKIWSSWQEGERPTCAIALSHSWTAAWTREACREQSRPSSQRPPCLPYQPLPASAPEKQWTKINREHHLESNTTMPSPHVWSHAWIGRLPSTAANFPSSHHLVTMQALCKSKVTWTIQIKNSKIISTQPSTCWKWVHHGLVVFPQPGIVASLLWREKKNTRYIDSRKSNFHSSSFVCSQSISIIIVTFNGTMDALTVCFKNIWF